MSQSDPVSARLLGLRGCSICTAVNALHAQTCVQCGSGMDRLQRHSLQTTWAWLLTAIILYIPANFLPIIETTFLGETEKNTIFGGVIALWQSGSYPVAAIIFVASVFVPIAKLLIIGWLCLSVQFRWTQSMSRKMHLYRITEYIGRWSMIDVFVVGILVALVQVGTLMTVLPGPAALAFAAMVVASMLAAMAFDPRLLWNHRDAETRS